MKNKCYAHKLGNCSQKGSHEHYISEGILKLIGPFIEVSGFPWLQGKTKKLPSKALTSNILCAYHNNSLSELDAIAIGFFGTLRRFDRELGENNLMSENKIFSGYLLESWFIKLYLGLHSGGHFDSKLNKIESYLLKNLFYSERLPHDLGLYFGAALGSRVCSFNGLSIETFKNPGLDISLMTCKFAGMPFFLSIRPGKLGGTGKLSVPYQYHPIGLQLKNNNHTVTKEITFVW